MHTNQWISKTESGSLTQQSGWAGVLGLEKNGDGACAVREKPPPFSSSYADSLSATTSYHPIQAVIATACLTETIP